MRLVNLVSGKCSKTRARYITIIPCKFLRRLPVNHSGQLNLWDKTQCFCVLERKMVPGKRGVLNLIEPLNNIELGGRTTQFDFLPEDSTNPILQGQIFNQIHLGELHLEVVPRCTVFLIQVRPSIRELQSFRSAGLCPSGK